VDPYSPDVWQKRVDCDGIVALTGRIDQTGLSVREVELDMVEECDGCPLFG